MTGERGGQRPQGDPTARDGARQESSAAKYAGIGLQFAVTIVAFLYGGQWLDRKLGTAPWCMIAGVFLGAGGAFYSIYRRLMADLKREEEAKRASRSGGR